LPPDWKKQAFETGAFQRSRKIPSPENLIRLLLIHLTGCSLGETVIRAEEEGITSITRESLFNRFLRAGEWFRVMAMKLNPTPTRIKDRCILIVDASTVSKPGSVGMDYRLHYAMELSTLKCVHVEWTDKHVGETLKRFPVRPQDLFVVDRGYSNAPGILHVIDNGGDVLVRLNPKSLPLYEKSGEPIAVYERVKDMREEEIREWEIGIKRPNGERIPGRLLAYKIRLDQAQRAKRKAQRKAKRKKQGLSPEALALHDYVLLWTTVGEEWSAQELLDLYRARWQIELVFKRMKSIMGLGDLLKFNPESAKAWLQGKLLLALIVEKLIERGDARSEKKGVNHPRRSRWRETVLVYRELIFAIIPKLGLARMLENWSLIITRLTERKRKRKFQLIELSCLLA